MNANIVDFLVQEIRDLLAVSSVGLYEFMWILNRPDLTTSMEEREALARQALERLLSEHGVVLIRMRWPEWTSQRTLTLDQLPANPWGDPDEDGMYLALNRVE